MSSDSKPTLTCPQCQSTDIRDYNWGVFGLPVEGPNKACYGCGLRFNEVEERHKAEEKILNDIAKKFGESRGSTPGALGLQRYPSKPKN
jgi:hypothetical protein